MSESLFQISCPSCESVFAVTDPELVGQIIACPKCGGMMLVEAAKVAANAEAARNSEVELNAEVGETARDGEALTDVEPSAESVTRREEKAQDQGISEETSAEDGENDAERGRSRGGGKFVASGIALALVGALTFGGLRFFNGEPTPTSETNVEAENDENNENGKDGGNGEVASSEAKDDVGGFAPRAVFLKLVYNNVRNFPPKMSANGGGRNSRSPSLCKSNKDIEATVRIKYFKLWNQIKSLQ